MAFENLHKQPDGSAKPWQGKSVEDFIVPPGGGLQSFNEFSPREIKPSARPIAAPSDDAVVA